VFKVLDENIETTGKHMSIGTMHLAKGLEFRAVMACDGNPLIVFSGARSPSR
jgi:superfamily I DNA/RNA helicase